MAAARGKERELAGLSTGYRTGQQLKLNVNRDKALLLGVPLGDLYFAIQSAGSSRSARSRAETACGW